MGIDEEAAATGTVENRIPAKSAKPHKIKATVFSITASRSEQSLGLHRRLSPEKVVRQ